MRRRGGVTVRRGPGKREAVKVTATEDDRRAGGGSRRRPRAAAGVRRTRTVRFGLTDAEFELVSGAAEAGLAHGAYAARAALAAARGGLSVADDPARQALAELIRAAGLVRRIGV